MLSSNSWGESAGLEYRDVVEKQAMLLRRSQDTIDELTEEGTRFLRLTQQRIPDCLEGLEELATQLGRVQVQQESWEVSDLRMRLDLSTREIETLRQQLERARIQTTREAAVPDATQYGQDPPDDYVRALEVMETEIERLRELGQHWQDEHKKQDQLRGDLQSKLERCHSARLQENHEMQRLQTRLADASRRVTELQETNSDLQTMQQLQTEELQTLLTQFEALQKRKGRLQDVVGTAGGKLQEGEDRVGESLRLVEAALLEKDTALLREKHMRGEVERLQTALEKLSAAAGEKTKTELTKAKDERNKKIKAISEELAQRERSVASAMASNADLQQQLDATKRRLLAVEEKLANEQVQQQQEHQQLHQRIAELEVRAEEATKGERSAREREDSARERYNKQAAELERRARQVSDQLASARTQTEQATLQCRALKRTLEHEQIQAAADLVSYKTQVENLNKALKQLKREAEEARNEHLRRAADQKTSHEVALSKLYDRLDEAQNKTTRLLEEREMERQKMREEHASLMRSLEASLAESNARLTALAPRLAEQTARADHAQHRLDTSLVKLLECEDKLLQAQAEVPEGPPSSQCRCGLYGTEGPPFPPCRCGP